MCISRATWGSSGIRDFVLCWQGLGGGSAQLKHGPSCGCQPPGLPDLLFLGCVCVVMDCAVSLLLAVSVKRLDY